VTPPAPKRPGGKGRARPMWAIVRDGSPVSMSASVIGPSACFRNWEARAGHAVLEMPGDRIVKYLPAPTRARARKAR